MHIQPIESEQGKISAGHVHSRLRQMILNGTMRAGTVLSQVQLAQELGVSRTPLREALRMLQEEGLILAEYNHRVRVADLDIGELEAFYANRIMQEALGIALTIPRLTQAEIDELARTLEQMHQASERRDTDVFEEGNLRFHSLLSAHAGERMQAHIIRAIDASERYRRIKLETVARAWEVAEAEHTAIFVACRERNVDAAVEHLTRHLARTALTLIAQVDPTYEPVAVRTALRLLDGKKGK